MWELEDFKTKSILARNTVLRAHFSHASLFKKTRTNILNEQRKNFDETFKFAVSHSPFYKEFYGDHGLLRKKKLFVHDLPVLTKELLMENFDGIITSKTPGLTRDAIDSFVAKGVSWIYKDEYLLVKSTGTSGFHALMVYTKAEFANSLGLLMKRLPKRKSFGTRSAYLYGSDPSHLSYKFSKVSFPLVNVAKHFPTQWRTEKIVQELNLFKPNLISSFPSTLKVLVEEIRAGRLNLPRPLSVLSSGEMLERDLVVDIQDAMGTTPFNVYGGIEAYPMAQDCPFHSLHVNEDHFILEADPAGGLITNLMNRTVPILRYRIDDLYQFESEACPCGSRFQALTLSDAKRTGQFFIPDGASRKKVNTMAFKDTIYGFLEVIQSQIQQTGPRDFTVRVVTHSPSSDLALRLKKRLLDALSKGGVSESEVTVTIQFGERSDLLTKNGKVKHFLPLEWWKAN